MGLFLDSDNEDGDNIEEMMLKKTSISGDNQNKKALKDSQAKTKDAPTKPDANNKVASNKDANKTNNRDDKENQNNRTEGGKRVLDARKAQEGPQDDREERNNRRNRGSDGTGSGNEVRQNDERKAGSTGRPKGADERPPRGAGGRGGRGGRGGGRGGKREFERKSGDDRTGVKSVDKREGSGSHNWGTYEDDIKAEQDQANTSTAETGQTTDAPATDAAKSEDKTTNGVNEKEEEREKEEVTYTLDEWKAQQGEKQGQKFNTRKAGEGDDLDPKWKKTYAYKKEKETHDEEDEEDSELYPQRVHRQKKIVDIEFNFTDL